MQQQLLLRSLYWSIARCEVLIQHAVTYNNPEMILVVNTNKWSLDIQRVVYISNSTRLDPHL